MKNKISIFLFVSSVIYCSAQLSTAKNGELDFNKSTKTTVKTEKTGSLTRTITRTMRSVTPFKKPQYKSGDNDLLAFIGNNFEYPKSKSKGTLELFFQVDKNGKLSNFTIIKSLNEYYDDEIIRVLMLTKHSDWTPGEEKEVPKKLIYNLNINFN